MAFSTGIGDRGGLRSPREEQSSFAALGLTSPLRGTFGSQAANSNAGDVRGQLHRRFTTNNIPTLNTPLSPIGQQRRQAAEPAEFTTAVRSGALSFLEFKIWIRAKSVDMYFPPAFAYVWRVRPYKEQNSLPAKLCEIRVKADRTDNRPITSFRW